MTEASRPLIQYLACPRCGGALSRTVFAGTETVIEEGLLTCGCGASYPVVEGIPRMLPDALARHPAWAAEHGLLSPGTPRPGGPPPMQAPETVRCFGVEWSRHPRPYPPEKLRQVVLGQTGLPPEDFRGRLILDAGCGHGSQAAFMGELGARVIGVDLSPDAAAVARQKIGRDARGLVVQADLACLPFPDGLFDLVYSEGVLHHTRDPKASFRHLVRKVRPGGYIAAGFYLKPSWATGRLRLWANEGLRRVLCRLPTPCVRALTFLSVPLTAIPLVRAAAVRTFVFWDPENPGWRETWMLNFDWYGTHAYQYYFSEEEVLALFNERELRLTDLFRGKPNFFRATVSPGPAQARAVAGTAPRPS